MILSYELFHINNKLELLKQQPKDSDKNKIQELLSILDVEKFEENICNQYSWYGYEKETFRNVSNFLDHSEKLKYKISNNKLNSILEDFRSDLLEFRNYAGKTLYLEIDCFKPDKNRDNNEESERQKCELIDQKADKAYTKLKNLLRYLNEYNYI